MKWRAVLLCTVLLLLTGCTRYYKPDPGSAPVQAPVTNAPPLADLVQEVKAINQNLSATKDKAVYKQNWDRLLPALDAALDHPDAWILPGGTLPVRLVIDRPEYRVYSYEGNYVYLGADPAWRNFWVQWRDDRGATHAQVLYRGSGQGENSRTVKAYDNLLLMLSDGQGARLEAWQRSGDGWRPVSKPLLAVGPTLGDMEVTRTAEGLMVKYGWWRTFTADGAKPDDSGTGVPYVCPGPNAPSVLCFRLNVQGGGVTFAPRDAQAVARLSDPATIKANLAIGYADGGEKSADATVANNAAKLAEAGMADYLSKPLAQQLAPDAFRTFFKNSAPGSVDLDEVGPSTRVYTMITRPEYQPYATSWVQWWTDPNKPHVQVLQTERFDVLSGAALFGSASDKVLVYTYATFPTRHETHRSAAALRLDAAGQSWAPDPRAFAADLPTAVGKVSLDRWPTGAGISMYRPDNPPFSNKLALDPVKQSLTACDTDTLCITLVYQDRTFVLQK